MPLDPAPDFTSRPLLDLVDLAQVERHAELLERYRDVSAEAICSDIVILAQLAAFKVRQEKILATAREAHLDGATHDCGEWKTRELRCAVCGKDLA